MCLAHFLGQMLKCCYPLKSELKSHKINILVQIKGIEGIPFITRFKTTSCKSFSSKVPIVLKVFHL